jgi:hypothetical protein
MFLGEKWSQSGIHSAWLGRYKVTDACTVLSAPEGTTFMTADSTEWHRLLANVTGVLLRGEQRITTHELLTVHLGVSVTDQACRRLRRVMRDLGWQGPRRMRWGKDTLNGYWRDPTVGRRMIVHEQPMKTLTPEEGTLAAELQSVTQLGLQKIGQILRLPTDPHNGNVLRAQTMAAATAVNAQLRADETKMKQQQNEDVLQELIKRMKEEKAKLAELGIEPFGFKRAEHGGTP